MKKHFLLISILCLSIGAMAQTSSFKQIDFLFGNWEGTGSSFGNDQSKIVSSFLPVMDGQYIEVTNDSKFEPTANNPEGEHHVDKGMISFDKARNLVVFRQFNNEGYINQYVLVDSLSTGNKLVFETESIENFMPGGSAKWTIERSLILKLKPIFT